MGDKKRKYAPDTAQQRGPVQHGYGYGNEQKNSHKKPRIVSSRSQSKQPTDIPVKDYQSQKWDANEFTDLKHPKFRAHEKPKPVADPHTSLAPTELGKRAREIVALQAQASFELQDDLELQKEYTKLAGEDVNMAALNLGQVLHSKQPLLLACTDTTSTSDRNHLPLPAIPSLPTVLDRSAAFPPALPPCLDKKLEEVAFTNRTSLNDSIFHRDHNAYYDRLEFVGDAYMEVIATRLLYNRYPNMPVGKLAHLRENLVSNATIADFAMRYKFDERAKLPDIYTSEVMRGAPLSKNLVKILADMFEAYVAAVIMGDPAHGFGAAETWLSALWRRQLPGQNDIQEVDPMAKSELAKKVLGRGIRLEYVDLFGPVFKGVAGRNSFTVVAKLFGWGWEDVELGRGEDNSLQNAGARAAMEGLVNPLTAQVALIKSKYDELVRAEREKEDGPDQAVIDELDRVYKHTPRQKDQDMDEAEASQLAQGKSKKADSDGSKEKAKKDQAKEQNGKPKTEHAKKEKKEKSKEEHVELDAACDAKEGKKKDKKDKKDKERKKKKKAEEFM
ncbi:MAG: hypothetical protein MMC23_008012 [Stictis urceolatum]|nr:hypothetical protein [Stictis urceolata]